MFLSHPSNLAITIEKQGTGKITKSGFARNQGKHSAIRTSEYEFLFNLNGEIKFIRGLNTNWPHPSEQLKRTDGNDWVHYSVGDDSTENGIISWMGEYYLPCLPYPSNSIWEVNYLSNPHILNALGAWSQLYANLYGAAQKNDLHSKSKALINLILSHDDGVLYERSNNLREIIGGRVSVLPPDTRHVDYDIIPIIIADGCLYHCKFCCVKSATQFQTRSRTEILEQIRCLNTFYGRNLENYNAIFLGNHDALEAGEKLLCFAASEAFKTFGFEEREAPRLFLFGSVGSLLKSDHHIFEKINQLPFYTYINIGLESIDVPTLALIGKPLEESEVREAFKKMLQINAAYANIEMTCNFLIGEQLPQTHFQSLTELLQDAPAYSHGKGTVYLSPLKDSPKKRELLPQFFEIKNHSKFPVNVYLIQRL